MVTAWSLSGCGLITKRLRLVPMLRRWNAYRVAPAASFVILIKQWFCFQSVVISIRYLEKSRFCKFQNDLLFEPLEWLDRHSNARALERVFWLHHLNHYLCGTTSIWSFREVTCPIMGGDVPVHGKWRVPLWEVMCPFMGDWRLVSMIDS